jgi:hypothetical protein
LNLRPLGYEQCDARLRRCAQSHPAWLTSAYANCLSLQSCRVSPAFGQFHGAAFTNPFTDWGADRRLLNLSRGLDREVRPSVAP